MLIQLVFNNPLLVSSSDLPSNLIITFYGLRFFVGSAENNSIKDIIEIKRQLPRQTNIETANAVEFGSNVVS